jgi:hypothetical protein
MRLNEIADLYERVQSLMHNCPDVLKLDVDSDSKSVTYVSFVYRRGEADSAGASRKIGMYMLLRIFRICSLIPKPPRLLRGTLS